MIITFTNVDFSCYNLPSYPFGKENGGLRQEKMRVVVFEKALPLGQIKWISSKVRAFSELSLELSHIYFGDF